MSPGSLSGHALRARSRPSSRLPNASAELARARRRGHPYDCRRRAHPRRDGAEHGARNNIERDARERRRTRRRATRSSPLRAPSEDRKSASASRRSTATTPSIGSNRRARNGKGSPPIPTPRCTRAWASASRPPARRATASATKIVRTSRGCNARLDGARASRPSSSAAQDDSPGLRVGLDFPRVGVARGDRWTRSRCGGRALHRRRGGVPRAGRGEEGGRRKGAPPAGGARRSAHRADAQARGGRRPDAASEAEKAARDLRAAIETPLNAAASRARLALIERLKAALAALAPKLHELREMDEWKRFANAAVRKR